MRGVKSRPRSELTYGVLVFVRVDAGVHDSSKEIVHDAGQRLSVQHAVQSADKHRLAGIQTLGRTAHVVAVRDHPGDDLDLEQKQAAAISNLKTPSQTKSTMMVKGMS